MMIEGSGHCPLEIKIWITIFSDNIDLDPDRCTGKILISFPPPVHSPLRPPLLATTTTTRLTTGCVNNQSWGSVTFWCGSGSPDQSS